MNARQRHAVSLMRHWVTYGAHESGAHHQTWRSLIKRGLAEEKGGRYFIGPKGTLRGWDAEDMFSRLRGCHSVKKRGSWWSDRWDIHILPYQDDRDRYHAIARMNGKRGERSILLFGDSYDALMMRIDYLFPE
jgi:hypothetical protein